VKDLTELLRHYEQGEFIRNREGSTIQRLKRRAHITAQMEKISVRLGPKGEQVSAEDFAAVRHYADRKDHVSAEANKAIIAALARLEARMAAAEEAMHIALDHCEALTAALRETVDIIEWMSGSMDFGPEGKAHEGWIKARDRYVLARAALATSEQATEEGAQVVADLRKR
jgi:hypothetical protein